MMKSLGSTPTFKENVIIANARSTISLRVGLRTGFTSSVRGLLLNLLTVRSRSARSFRSGLAAVFLGQLRRKLLRSFAWLQNLKFTLVEY
jgi:hypothetical protein